MRPSVDAFIDDTFNGTVKDVRLQPSISSNVVTYSTLIDAPNDDKKLKPGMTANIVIFTKQADDALLLSAQSLKYSPDSGLVKQYRLMPLAKKEEGAGKGTVWTVQGNQLIQKAVTTGLNDNTHVQILTGLDENDVVVTGAEVQAKGARSASSSPFLPQRPKR